MRQRSQIPRWKDKILFTPGPLTTSLSTKQAMLCDLGSRDDEFIKLVADIRKRLLAVAGVNHPQYEAILMQGSGTFGLEAVISSCIPQDGKLLVISNGAYGRRMAKIATIHKIEVIQFENPENERLDVDALRTHLRENQGITHVAVVHCETTSGIINPIEKIGELVHAAGKRFIVDAMSSFGGISLNLLEAHADFLVTSANKCIEGVPGFSVILAKHDALVETQGWARSLSLDLHAQWEGLERNGQFRFTPPTHALLAFHQALIELEAEGGVQARALRYANNHKVLLDGMLSMRFKTYLNPEDQGPIITSFYYPEHPAFNFEHFYQRLNARQFVIYPGKVSDADCFRIGSIGRIFPSDVCDLLHAISDVLMEMGIDVPLNNSEPEEKRRS